MTSTAPFGLRDPVPGTLIRLRGLYPSLKAALQKVAEMILSQPERAIYASVNEVAAAAGVSEATVMRFCRILGFKGFQDFKIALARELVGSSQISQEEEETGEGPDAAIRRVFQAHLASLQDTLEVLDSRVMMEAAQALAAARLIAVVGVGLAGPIVAETVNKFHPFNTKVQGFTDSYLMLAAAERLTSEEALLAICHSGSTQEVVEAARIARKNGARVIAITCDLLAPLTKTSDLVLITACREMGCGKGIIASSLSQVAITDSLVALMSFQQPGGRPA